MKQTLGPFKKFRVTRAEGVVINRFWIGHAWATKFHILSQRHHNSTSCTSSHSSHTASPVSHKNSYMNHVNIYPFSDVLSPQCALGSTIYQCYVHLAVQCIIHPHWASGATILQHHVHLAIPGVLGPQWAIGATIWTTSRSSHFRTFCVPNEPWEPLYVSPVSPGNHHTSKFCTSSHSGRTGSPVSHRSHYMSHAMIYPFPDILFWQWAMEATSYQCHVHVDVRCIMCPHWALGAPMLQNPLQIAILDVPGPLWAIWATIWTTSRSIHFQTFYVPTEPWEPLDINVIYI